MKIIINCGLMASNIISLLENYEGELHVGDKVEIIPSHACPLVNLADEMVLVDGSDVIGQLKVDARGKTN